MQAMQNLVESGVAGDLNFRLDPNRAKIFSIVLADKAFNATRVKELAIIPRRELSLANVAAKRAAGIFRFFKDRATCGQTSVRAIKQARGL